MNFIVVMADTLRADHLGCYGNDWIHTPNLDRLAREGTVFDRAYAASYPTIPNRTDLVTGRYGEPLHPWGPLSTAEIVLPKVMDLNGYVTQLVCDTPHLINQGAGFQTPFRAWWMVRGQQGDGYRTDSAGPDDGSLPDVTSAGGFASARTQYMRNMQGRRLERDYFAPKVMQAAMDWIELNRGCERFFLWIDSFDPHEPWDPPQHYVDLYDPGCRKGIPPNLSNEKALTARERRQVHARYAGEVTMLDHWLGRLLDRLDVLGLADSTAVTVISDHGTGLWDHKRMSKSAPFYEEVSRIVWIMRVPNKGGRMRIRALVQPPDLMPTLLDLAGVEIPDRVQGKSVLPLLDGSKRANWDAAITGSAPCLQAPTPVTVTTLRWSLVTVPGQRELYDLREDPKQKRNVVRKHPDMAQMLWSKMLKRFQQIGTPEWIMEAFSTGKEHVSPHVKDESHQLLAVRKYLMRGLSREAALSRRRHKQAGH